MVHCEQSPISFQRFARASAGVGGERELIYLVAIHLACRSAADSERGRAESPPAGNMCRPRTARAGDPNSLHTPAEGSVGAGLMALMPAAATGTAGG